jgi:serine/threonine protein kinase
VQVLESGHEETEVDEEGVSSGAGTKRKITVPFIVLECLSGGSLTYKLTRKRIFGGRPFANDVDLYSYMISLAEAMHFLHYEFDSSVHVLHRDLKPDNIAFTDDGRLKLIDFGLSICIKRFANAEDTYVMTGETGSLRYMAPEVIVNKPYNCKADVFSFAVVSWEMCTGVVPHAGMSREKFIRHIVERKQRPGILTDPYGVKIIQPQEMKDLWKACWDDDMGKRWTMKEILEKLKVIRENALANSQNSSCVCN